MVAHYTQGTTFALAAIVLFLAAFIHASSDEASLTGYQVADIPSVSQPPLFALEQQSSTPLGNAVQFLKDFGFFSVVLPFLLIFAIVFGILEKTKILGTEKEKDADVPRRNLNSVVAFCIAFFVVAASNIVSVIQASIPAIALVLVIIIVFLLLFGSLMGQEDLKHGIALWNTSLGKTFAIAIFIAVLAIFLGVFGVLGTIIEYVGANVGGTFITSIFLLIIVVIALSFMTKKTKGATP